MQWIDIRRPFFTDLFALFCFRELYESAPDLEYLGWITLTLPWLPGLARIAFVAVDEPWNVTWIEVLLRLGGYLLVFIGWPVFPNLV